MTGFASHLLKKAKHPIHEAVATKQRWRVIRWDGTVLAGSASRESAQRVCRIVCTGQRDGYALVTGVRS